MVLDGHKGQPLNLRSGALLYHPPWLLTTHLGGLALPLAFAACQLPSFLCQLPPPSQWAQPPGIPHTPAPPQAGASALLPPSLEVLTPPSQPFHSAEPSSRKSSRFTPFWSISGSPPAPRTHSSTQNVLNNGGPQMELRVCWACEGT